MNWEGITEFVAVVEQRSFTLAAKKLGISTAKVSRQINLLETRLSSKLLNRTTRVKKRLICCLRLNVQLSTPVVVLFRAALAKS